MSKWAMCSHLKISITTTLYQAPARYNEASLVKELEKRGSVVLLPTLALFRPFKIAMQLDNKRFYATKMGEIVIDRLSQNFADPMSYDFTAKMEQRLDDVAHGHKAWKDAKYLYDDFYALLLTAEKPEEEGGMHANSAVQIELDCPECTRPMNVHCEYWRLFGLNGYNLPPKERCTKTLNFTPGDEAIALQTKKTLKQKPYVLKTLAHCVIRQWIVMVNETTKLHVCGNTKLPRDYN